MGLRRVEQPGTPMLPAVPPSAPRVKPNRFTRWLGRTILRLSGWRLRGEIPDQSKLVLIVAPHSSNWDGLWGFATKLALGLEIRVLGKHQLFWWPLGPVLRGLGAIPVDRAAPHGIIEQATKMIVDTPRIWFAVTPEGTRKAVKRWKTGFWKIAKAAKVPVFPVYFHYPDKVIGLGNLFYPGDDMDADVQALREWYAPWVGRTRGTVWVE